jgi:uncharacterized protein YceH (UPF0502 family)
MVQLSAVEARVVGSLVEKEITTPEYYPLSLNATLNACNQKSSREPVMQLVESDVRTALFELDKLGLVRTIADGRVSKFEHRLRDVLTLQPNEQGRSAGAPGLRRDEVAVVCLLLLRGPQTPAELRARAERMYRFEDNAAVMSTLERLAGREEPLVQLMARQPGAREARWVHLLCGPVSEAQMNAGMGAGAQAHVSEGRQGATDSLVGRMEELEELVRALEERVARLEVEAEG